MAKTSNAALTFTRPNSKEEVKLDYASMRKAALVVRAVSHPVRQKMLALIEEKKKVTVTEIYTKMKLEQSVASQHLAILRKAKIAIATRDGKFIHYGIDKKQVDLITTLTSELSKKV